MTTPTETRPTPTTRPHRTDPTDLRALADAIARGEATDRHLLARALTQAIATLPPTLRPSWTVTAADAEVVLHRALDHVLRLVPTSSGAVAPAWIAAAAA